MFFWPIRKYQIADWISQEEVDIVGLQEVRSLGTGASGNQLFQLQETLQLKKEYPYAVYASSCPVTGGEGVEEGVALLSRYPIIEYEVKNLTHPPSDPDSNSRVILRALVKMSEDIQINIFVTHFSYIQRTQCFNAFELLSFINKFSGRIPKIILGDFNTYNDFEVPIEYLTKRMSPKHPSKPNNNLAKNGEQFNSVHQQNSEQNAVWCHNFFQNHVSDQNERNDNDDDGELIDAWAELFPEKPGFTFSNMPWPGLVSRPDRIFY